jgi:TolB-like protein/Flp pilus assembly protein TadD
MATPTPTRWLDTLKRLKAPIVAIAGVGAVLSGLVGWYTTWHTVSTAASSSAPATAGANADAGPLSIIVLPLANQTGDPSKAYVADGLTSSITADLSRIQGAYIAAPATAYSLRDKGLSVQQIGQSTGVRFVLQGSVLASGEQLRIQVQLADAQSGAQLWTDTHEGSMTDLFALQDQVTARVGNSLGQQLVLAAARAGEARKSGNPKVADLMLQSRALKLQPQSLKGHQQAELLDRQILKLEPGQVQSTVGLAMDLLLQSTNFHFETGEQASRQKVTEAEALIARAREADPQNPSVYNALAIIARYRQDRAAQIEYAKTFTTLAARNPAAFNTLGLAYLDAGDAAQAAAAFSQAIALNPRGARETTLDNLGTAHHMLGDNAAAIAMFRQAVDKNPRYVPALADLAIAYASAGDMDKARQYVAETLRVQPNFKIGWLNHGPNLSPGRKAYQETRLLPDARKAGFSD